jgi:putative hydrolases of HD superfamily
MSCSISDHMYRMAVMAMCTTDASLDVAKCVLLAVVHDIAEAQGLLTAPVTRDMKLISSVSYAVGDIAPREGIAKAEKRRLEKVRTYLTPVIPSTDAQGDSLQEAMENFVREMLHDSPPAQRIMALWEEYEAQETTEARFVKGWSSLSARSRVRPHSTSLPDLDRFEMATQGTISHTMFPCRN